MVRPVAGPALRLDRDSASFAFVAVWAPMAGLGTLSHVVRVRLPARWYRLRPWERDGRVHELLGVRVAKRILRRGPLARFNPHLHLPSEPSAERWRELEGRMEVAEATHTILFLVTTGWAVAEVGRGRTRTARWMLLWNVLMNGYPALLQRYNRALLHARHPEVFAERS